MEKLANLLGEFIDELEKAPQVNWWDAFFEAVPEAKRLMGEVEVIMEGDPPKEITDIKARLKEISTADLYRLEALTETINKLAEEYAAARGEKVPPWPSEEQPQEANRPCRK